MPVWVSSFLIGSFVGYYLLNDTVRHLINQIVLTVLKLFHKAFVFLLRGCLLGLNWCYDPKQQIKQAIPKTASTVRPQPSFVKAVRQPDGSTVIETTSEEVDKWLKNNPDIKISEKQNE